ncbi:MAG: alpha/beta fold hydrolase, partial [Planctomycetales bacterium]|nr:alpha/beta fold hydrolase [Planctomycetales bacterium]
GYSYATKQGLIEEEFVLILQGNAMMAERVAQLADEVADRTSRRVYVFAYRGYGNDEQEVPSTGALLGDTVEVVARLFGQSGTRKGVLVGISMGGIFALHAAKQLPHLNLHLLLDSVPARIPTVFVSLCPKYLDPIEMLSDELLGRTGIIYSESDPNYTGVADADRMIGRIRSRSTFVEKVDTAHAELSPRGVLVRAPLYAKYIDGKASR